MTDGGAATYTIPIAIPPGTNGMAPNLALAYSSQGENGLFGVGWGLEGLSVIHRCKKTLAADGFNGSVRLDGSDEFCLDGDRLVLVSGTHGQSGAEYRGEKEIWSRVIVQGTASGGGPLSFQVWTKAGRILEYGTSLDSRLENSNKVESWHLNKVVDRFGNDYTISYEKNPSLGFVRPVRFDYTGNVAAGLAPYASVRLVYEARPDPSMRYAFGAEHHLPGRVARIETYLGEQLVRRYLLGYEISPGSSRSRIVSITECAADGSCVPATSLDWTESSAPAWSIQTSQMLGIDWYDNEEWLTHDLNGDGITDLVMLYPHSAGVTIVTRLGTPSGTYVAGEMTVVSGAGYVRQHPNGQWSTHGWAAADINGDGMGDLIGIYRSTTGWHPQPFVGDGVGAFSGQALGPGVNNTLVSPLWAADLTGDGRDEYVLTHSYLVAGGSPWGGGFFAYARHYFSEYTPGQNGELSLLRTDCCTVEPGPVAILPLNWRSTPFVGADLDADGNRDPIILLWYGSNGEISLVRGGPTEPSWSQTILSWSGHVRGVSGDWNGDGLADALMALSDQNHTQTTLRSVFDTGLGGYALAPASTPLNDLQAADELLPLDIDADGRTDIVRIRNVSGNAVVSVLRSNGDGSFSPYGATTTLWAWSDDDVWLTGDHDGDGFSDLLVIRKSGSQAQLVPVSTLGPALDLITGITDGFGAQIEIDYAPLTDPAVYTKGSGASYPLQDVQVPMYVVSRHRQTNGAYGLRGFTYAYAGARQHLQGRGFLGFAERTVIDDASGSYVRTHLRQDFPLNGFVSRIEERLASHTLVSETDNTWSIVDLGNRWFARLDQKVEKTYELDGTLVTTKTTYQEFDGYGNVTSLGVVTQDGSSSPQSFIDVVATTYVNNTSSWLLGLVDQTQTTGLAPDRPWLTRTTDYELDPITGALTAEISDGGRPFALRKDYTYDAFGNVRTIAVSGAGIPTRSESVTYDALGRFAVEVENAIGHVEARQYDPRFGVETQRAGPDPSFVATTAIDALGRPQSVAYADGTSEGVWRFFCAAACVPGSVYAEAAYRSGNPPTITYYDALGREVTRRTIGLDGRSIDVESTYDVRGRVQSVTQPHFDGDAEYTTIYEYDDLDRVIRETKPDGGVHTALYAGLSVTFTNAKNQHRTETRDARGKLVHVQEELGATNTYTYDAFGRPLTVTDSYGNVVENTYDLRGKKIASSDPDMGVWTYAYNALGELVSQTDALGRTITFAYDLLGRAITRTEYDGGVTTWEYDTAANGIGRLAHATAPTVERAFERTYTYDAFGRPSSSTWQIDGATYTITPTYDALGRIFEITYPNGTVARNLYTTYTSHLYEVQVLVPGNPTPKSIWKADAANAYGQVTQETLGNGLNTQRVFDPAQGVVTDILTGSGSTWQVQNLQYEWDTLGNLTKRRDERQQIEESFGYDALNRLRTVTGIGGVPSKSIDYDLVGNIASKSDVGTYSYGQNGAGPHAVTQAGSQTYTYDANGNQLARSSAQGENRWVYYTGYNKPRLSYVQDGAHGALSNFYYGPDRELIVQFEMGASGSATRTYIDRLFEKVVRSGGTTEYRANIYAGDSLVAVVKNASLSTIEWMHTDHLGSTDVITNTVGAEIMRMSFDAWGRRRNPNGTDAGMYAFAFQGGMGAAPSQGFTGHKSLDHLELVHMGGRMYDPVLGRFLSADPYVQFPESTQGFNRYTYVNNNPLSYVDPSGFWSLKKAFEKVGKWFKRAWKGFWSWHERLGKKIWGVIKPYLGMIVSMALFPVLGPAAPAIGAGFQTAINGGSIEQVFVAAALGFAAGYAGGIIGADRIAHTMSAHPLLATGSVLGSAYRAPKEGGWGLARWWPAIAAKFGEKMAKDILGSGKNESQSDPRALTSGERAFLENLTGQDFGGVRVDEGFLGERFAAGQVRSDAEINVFSGFSRLSATEQLALLSHESAHIVQRRAGTLNNFGGFFSHLGARLTGRDLYAFPDNFSGSFSSLNFEQQGVVLENTARLMLGQTPGDFRSGANLSAATVLRLYGEFRAGGP